MTLDDIDVLILATPGAAALYVAEADWEGLFGQPAPGCEVLKGGRIAYHGLPIRLRAQGSTEVVGRARAEADGLISLEPL